MTFDMTKMLATSAKGLNVQVVEATKAFGGYISPDKGLSMGLLSVDFVLRGGMPNGRMALFYGPYQSGKTTLVSRAMSMAQAYGRPIIFMDAEWSADFNYMRSLGVDITQSKKFGYAQPSGGDDAFRLLKRILENWDTKQYPAGPLIVVDSYKALTPSAFMADDTKTPMGAQAKMLSEWLAPMKTLVGQTKSVWLATNQVRSKIGVQFGDPEEVPGGNAQMFYSDVITRLSRVGKMEEGAFGLATNMRANFKRMKHAVPGANFDLPIVQGIGFDPTMDIWKFLELSRMAVTLSRGSLGLCYGVKPYPGLPDLPAPMEPADTETKKGFYNWKDMASKHMLPEHGKHYAHGPLYTWCYHIISTGAIFDAIDKHNMETLEEENKVDVRAGSVKMDYSRLTKNYSPEQFQKAVEEADAGGKPKAAKDDDASEWRLSEYAAKEAKKFETLQLVSDHYDMENECIIQKIFPTKKIAEVIWVSTGELEKIPLSSIIYREIAGKSA